jgi:uncharacterized protein (TIGR00156 family)
MKKAFIFGCLVLTIFALNAQQGGFSGPGLQVVTVQEAMTFRDDTPVLLQGRILQFLGNEKYLFIDGTGTIIVEIDDQLWKGVSIGENDKVEIIGEVDRNFRRIEIEAGSIKKL